MVRGKQVPAKVSPVPQSRDTSVSHPRTQDRTAPTPELNMDSSWGDASLLCGARHGHVKTEPPEICGICGEYYHSEQLKQHLALHESGALAQSSVNHDAAEGTGVQASLLDTQSGHFKVKTEINDNDVAVKTENLAESLLPADDNPVSPPGQQPKEESPPNGKQYTCETCHEQFEHFSSLQDHSVKCPYHDIECSAKRKGGHVCELCKEMFTDREALMRHTARHEVWECGVCRKRFPGPMNLAGHRRRHAREPPPTYRCGICGEYHTRERLIIHMAEHENRASPHTRRSDPPKPAASASNSAVVKADNEDVYSPLLLTVSDHSTEVKTEVEDDFRASPALSSGDDGDTHDVLIHSQHTSSIQDLVDQTDLPASRNEDVMIRTEVPASLLLTARSLPVQHRTDGAPIHVYQCGLCNAKLDNFLNLQKHINLHLVSKTLEKEQKKDPVSKLYHCTPCVKSYVVRRSLMQHQQSHHNGRYSRAGSSDSEQIHQRDRGDAVSVTASLSDTAGSQSAVPVFLLPTTNGNTQRTVEPASPMDKSRSQASPVRPYKRPTPSFPQSNTSKVPRTTHTDDKPFQCEICDEKFDTASRLVAHTEIHNDETEFKCDVCDEHCSSGESLAAHMKTHTGQKPFQCNVCEERFFQHETLKKHMMRTHPTGNERRMPYQCEVCGERQVTRLELRAHMKTHSIDKPYKCDVCDKRFTVPGSVIVHMRSHTGERPFLCQFCGRRFLESSSLFKHMRVHTNDKPHKCTLCDKRFVQASHLNNHMRKHTGEKPYACTVCNERFSQRPGLNYHMLTHTGEKPYRCEVCDEHFMRSRQLRKHMATHTGEKP